MNDVTGNFIHRTITFINQHFEGKIPERGQLFEEEKTLIENIRNEIKSYVEAMDNFKIKDATNIAINVARLGNQYFSTKEPWHLVKENKEKTATVLNISAKISEVITILLWPIMPKTTEQIWSALGFKGSPKDKGLDLIDLDEFNVGQKIEKIKPVFYKIKAKEVEQKLANFRAKEKKKQKSETQMERISFDEFKKVNLKVATVLEAEAIEKSKNLIKLKIDLGEEKRQILAGIKQYYKPEDLVGRQIIVVVNLAPATLMGEKSDGMLLAADIDGEPILLDVDKEVPPGTGIT